jgi:hypothetical protein
MGTEKRFKSQVIKPEKVATGPGMYNILYEWAVIFIYNFNSKGEKRNSYKL